jgi:hypothetical protein
MLDVPEAPEGYKYRWLRHELVGEDHSRNVFERTRQGYELVHPDELDGFETDVMQDGKHAGVVRSGDLILAKVPIEIYEARTEFYDNQADRLQQAVDMELDRSNNPDMPIDRKGSKSSVTRGNPNAANEFED